MDSAKKFILRALLVLMGMLFGIEASAQKAVEFVPGVVMVKFQYGKISRVAEKIGLNDINSIAVQRFLSSRGFKAGTKIFKGAAVGDTIAVALSGEPVKVLDLSHWFLIELDPGADVIGAADSLRLFPGVLAATPATVFRLQDTFPNDTHFQSGWQWGLHNYSSPGKDIRAVQAWDINRGRSDVVVAVVDGGVDYNHTDLDPGNRSRVIQGTDTGDDDSDPMDDLPEGGNLWGNHGTRVAGVIGAITNNAAGVAGIMWNCSIMPVKVGNSGGWGPFNWGAGSAFEWDIADGINWARNHGAHIINMSFGGEGLSEWERLFIGNPVGEATGNAYQQSLVLVAAMGNDDSNAIRYPASWPWNIAVGATNQNDSRVTGVGWGSNYGSHIDLSAPGISEYSTARSQSYGNFSGTSCATPFVSGVAGLVLSQSRDRGLNLTNDDVKHLLEVTADDVNSATFPGWDQFLGYGRINAYRALQLLSSPYTVTQSTVVGGTATLTWGSHTHTFYNNGGGLATGVYYGVKQYKVTNHVSFSQAYSQTPTVWARERQTQGWNYANPNLELQWAKIYNVTSTGFDVETVVYWIGTNSIGQQINAYYPCAPSQATVAYTILGIPQPLSVTITGPSVLLWKEFGTWTANPSGGVGPYTYEWRYRDNGTGDWSSVVSTSQNYTRQMPNNDIELQVRVTSGSEIAYDTHYVTLGPIDPKMANPIVVEESVIPESFTLSQNFPNPFNPETAIRFGLPQDEHVQLLITDLLGREIRKLADSNFSAGYHSVIWDGKDNAGNVVPSGVYIYQIVAGTFQDRKKLVLVR